jgi:mono/diheme cytochrome c family protein
MNWLAILLRGEEKMTGKQTRNHRAGSLVLLSLLLLALPRCTAAQEGQRVYDQTCAKCHGADGAGNTVVGKAVGAKDLGSAEAKKLTEDEIRTQIEKGKNNMPPFQGTLTKAQVDSLIPIVRAFGRKGAAPKKSS